MKVNYLPLAVIILGLVFMVNLFKLPNFCLGESLPLAGCLGVVFPLSLIAGLALVVVGAVAFLKDGKRRGASPSLKALGLLLVLVAIIGLVGGTAGFQSVIGGSSSLSAGANYTVAFLLFAIVGLLFYLKGRTRKR